MITMKRIFNFDNSYARLHKALFSRSLPKKVRQPELLLYNELLAEELGLEDLSPEERTEILSGNVLAKGSEPIAQAYCGHQFGYFTMLGDGRAILLGEHITPFGERIDVQLKGAGRTPYSRSGDGRAALGPMLREYLMSEAMHSLGIETTRSLAVVKTGEKVYRGLALDGAILTRTAKSHIRVGTFEYAAVMGELEVLKELADYSILRHYPELRLKTNPYLSFFRTIMKQQISLVVDWMRVGFVHGVLNTDNVSIAGETIDYGPCAFIDTYNSEAVFSSIDTYGRYAYGNQPGITRWNLVRLAESFIPLLVGTKIEDGKGGRIIKNKDEAMEVLNFELGGFMDEYNQKYYFMMARKLGFESFGEGDEELINELLTLMQDYAFDYTNTFVYLRHMLLPLKFEARLLLPLSEGALRVFNLWAEKWKKSLLSRTDKEKAVSVMEMENPIVIPRNRFVDEAIKLAERGDLSKFESLFTLLQSPYDYEGAELSNLLPPKSDEPFVTYCGT